MYTKLKIFSILVIAIQTVVFSDNSFDQNSLNKNCLAPNSSQNKVQIVDNLYNANKQNYLNLSKSINKYIEDSGKSIKIEFTAENGNDVIIDIPDPQLIPEDLFEKILENYLFKFHLQSILIGNPGSKLFVKILNNPNKEIEKLLIEKINNFINAPENRILKFANQGKKMEVYTKSSSFTAKKEKTLLKVPISYIKQGEIQKLINTDFVTIGYDLGGQSIRATIMVNGADVTKEILDEESGLLSKTSYSKDHNKEGGSGRELKERIYSYVKEISEIVEKKYGAIHAEFLSLPGVPDFENDCMVTIGDLDRGFPNSQKKPEEYKQNLKEANLFIKDIRKLLDSKGVHFGFGNDASSWAGAIVKNSDIKNGVILVGGTGIAVKRIKNSVPTAGVNEGAHFTYNSSAQIKSRSESSPIGSIEDWGGSLRGIMFWAQQTGVIEEIKNIFKIEDPFPIHFGLIATGHHPLSLDNKKFKNVKLTEKKYASVITKAKQTWQEVEKVQALHILLIHRMTKDTNFVLSGGTMGGETGPLRLKFLKQHLKEYCSQLKLDYSKFNVSVVSGNPGQGATELASQLYQDKLILETGKKYSPFDRFDKILSNFDNKIKKLKTLTSA